jgi:hypothetical protein
MPFLRRTRRFSTTPRNPQDFVVVVVVVAVAVAVAVAGVIPLVAAVRLRCEGCAGKPQLLACLPILAIRLKLDGRRADEV